MALMDLFDLWECASENILWEYFDVEDSPEESQQLQEEFHIPEKVQGGAILGYIKGPFFFPDGVSRNKRFYPKELWEKVIGAPSIKKRLKQRVMYGTIGHESTPMSDEDLRQGKPSHIVLDLALSEDQKIGIGVAAILDTDVGRRLSVYLKAGSVLSVSSRAKGTFEAHKRHKGLPVVAESDFELHTFDFVLNPGFEDAKPSLLQESITIQNHHTVMSGGKKRMDLEQIISELRKEKDVLQEQVTEVRLENARLTNELDSVNRDLSESKIYTERLAVFDSLHVTPEQAHALVEAVSSFDSISSVLDRLSATRNFPESLLEEFSGSLWEDYQQIGQPYEIRTLIEEMRDEIQQYRQIGQPGETRALLFRLVEMIEQYQTQFGTIEQADKLAEELDTLRLAGETPGSAAAFIGQIKQELQEYYELGTAEEVKQTLEQTNEVLQRVARLGSLSILEEIVQKQTEEQEQKLVEDLARKYRRPLEDVQDLLESLSPEQAEKALSKLTNVPQVRKTSTVTIHETGGERSGSRLSHMLRQNMKPSRK